jgi:Family of unknown function (DUF6093)
MRSTSRAALPDTCVIERPSGEPELDEDTLELTETATTIYEGPCRVRPRGSQEQDQPIGDLHQTLAPYVATLPYDAEDVRVDDYLTVTESSDADMVGRSFQIRHVGWSSWQIDRRLGLDDSEQPPGIEVMS